MAVSEMNPKIDNCPKIRESKIFSQKTDFAFIKNQQIEHNVNSRSVWKNNHLKSIQVKKLHLYLLIYLAFLKY
jgi:hypothetical protein